jgi:hypothetical protein
MKKSALVAAIVFIFVSCNNDTSDTPVNRDSANLNIDNTKTMMDTIANGDTTSYNRMNDLIRKDSLR